MFISEVWGLDNDIQIFFLLTLYCLYSYNVYITFYNQEEKQKISTLNKNCKTSLLFKIIPLIIPYILLAITSHITFLKCVCSSDHPSDEMGSKAKVWTHKIKPS